MKRLIILFFGLLIMSCTESVVDIEPDYVESRLFYSNSIPDWYEHINKKENGDFQVVENSIVIVDNGIYQLYVKNMGEDDFHILTYDEDGETHQVQYYLESFENEEEMIDAFEHAHECITKSTIIFL
jgi:predicted  nucleic acid-binding Zn-ribbon protein